MEAATVILCPLLQRTVLPPAGGHALDVVPQLRARERVIRGPWVGTGVSHMEQLKSEATAVRPSPQHWRCLELVLLSLTPQPIIGAPACHQPRAPSQWLPGPGSLLFRTSCLWTSKASGGFSRGRGVETTSTFFLLQVFI